MAGLIPVLSAIQHRSEEPQRALVRLKVREVRVNQINTLRFVLKSLGSFIQRSIEATAFTRKVRTLLSAADVALVAELLEAIDQLNAKLEQLDLELEPPGTDRYPATQHSRQVAGVGPLLLCADDRIA
ncbi:MAG TPA: hypothetical protein VGM64_14750 [Lacunisphaera sp.]